jgi:endoglucanase
MLTRPMRPFLFLCLSVIVVACTSDPALTPQGFGGRVSPAIQLNQVGYYPDQQVVFTYADTSTRMGRDGMDPRPARQYFITDVAGKETVREGSSGRPHDWTELAGVHAQTFILDPLPVGEYRVYLPEIGYSYPFAVKENVLRDAYIGSLRGLYYQRASQELTEEFAGEYARPAGHPDLNVAYHPSSGRSSGTRDSPGGWYDAGDYNKYIVNGAFPVGQMLALYEDVGDPAPDGTLNIPESGNGKSDYLDEMKVELDWMLTMQDEDGGLFHKLTTLNFEGMDKMPDAATSQRFIVGKSTTATLDFAAATAQAARIYRDYEPAYADRLLSASRMAWKWGRANPDAVYRNPADVRTGEYGDDNADDERAWAAAELFATTGEQEFYNDLQQNPPRIRFNAGESWTGFMANLAAFTLLRHPDRVPREMYDRVQGLVITLADSLVMAIDSNAYFQPITEFEWGSNSDVANAAMIIAAAHLREPKSEYLAAMRHCMNYLLGHNPNNVSYLTGHGDNSPMYIHHRPSNADGIEAPVPGLLSGGPNVKQQDREYTDYKPDAAPMQSWADQTGSYASNEICLNWNAPFTYLAGFLEAKQ